MERLAQIATTIRQGEGVNGSEEKMDKQQFHTFRGYEMIKKNKEYLTPSMEDYLEMIYRYCQAAGYVRINQLAEQLHVKASSASKTVSKLSAMGYLAYEKYGIVKLTSKGEMMGAFLLDRHDTVELFLKNIGVDDNVLIETELIEHYLSLETLQNIKILNNFLAASPEILQQLQHFKKKYAEPEADGT